MKQRFFLEEVADRVLELVDDGSDLALVVPNRRAGLYIKRYLARAIDKPMFLPVILTIEDLMTRLSGLIKMDSVQQLMLLYEAYREVGIGEDSFTKFLTWAPTFIKDCNDIDNSMADVELFFTVLYEDREIRNWNVDNEHTDLQRSYLKFWNEAHKLYDAYVSKLESHGASYAGLAYRRAIEGLESRGIQVPFDRVLFAGFNALNNAEERLIDHIVSQEKGEVWWDMDAYYVSDDEMKAGTYFRKYIQQWKSRPLPDRIGYRTENIFVIEAQGSTAQCDVVFSILKKLKDTDYKNEKIAIILTDESLLEPLLLRLPENMGPYNITMGKPLRDFGLYHLFESMLDFFSRSDGDGVYSRDLLSILSSPYINILDPSDRAQRIRQHIHSENVHTIHLDEVREMLGKSIWLDILSLPRRPIDVLTFLERIIQRLRAHYLSISDEGSIEILFECRNILNQLKTVYGDYSDVLSLGHLYRLYSQAGGMVRLPYEGEPLKGIQIMGLLESRGLDFDHVILLSANEGMLPESRAVNTFIPHVFRKYFKMPTYDQRDTIFAYSFYRLLHHAKRMDIVYNGLPNSEGGGELSRYVQQVEAEFLAGANTSAKLRRVSSQYEMKEQQSVAYSIEKTDEVIADIKSYLKEKMLSPSSINLLVRSPLDFYFEKVVHIREPDLIETTIADNTFGSIVHETLEDLYKPLVGKMLTQSILEDLLNKIEGLIDEKRKKLYKSGDVRTGYNYLMREAASSLVQEVIKADMERIKESSIEILEIEGELKSTLVVPIDGQDFEVVVRGFADRIQRCDGVVEIIDYKSGSIPDSLNINGKDDIGVNHKRDKRLQLLAYTWLASERIEGKVYDVSTIRSALLGLKSWQKGLRYIKDLHLVDTTEVIEQLKENIRDRIRDLIDPAIPFAPETEASRLIYSKHAGIYL